MSYKNCPICEQELIIAIEETPGDIFSEYLAICKNKCYSEYKGYGNTQIYVVNEEFVFHYKMTIKQYKKEKERLDRAVESEKKNDKYLARILTQN